MTQSPWLGRALASPESGAAARPLAGGAWQVPRAVELDGDRLIWSDREGYGVREAGPGLLEGFAALAVATPEQVRAYARRWGVLYLCEHGLPMTHNPGQSLGPRLWPEPPPPQVVRKGRRWHLVDDGTGPRVIQGCHLLPVETDRPPWCPPDHYWEPLAEWRRYAELARTLLTLAAALHEGKLGRPEDWRVVATPYDISQWDGPQPQRRPRLEEGRALVAEAVTDWLEVAGVRFSLQWSRQRLCVAPGPRISWEWSPEDPKILAGGGNLFGALGIQLMLAIGQTDGLAVCSACSLSYVPERRPRANQRRYCQKCRARKVPGRDAARAYRARHR